MDKETIDADMYQVICKERFEKNEEDHGDIKKTIKEVIRNQAYIRSKIDNGFGVAIASIKESIDKHIEEHRDDKKERDSKRRSFWRGMLIASGAPIVSGILVFLIIKALGG